MDFPEFSIEHYRIKFLDHLTGAKFAKADISVDQEALKSHILNVPGTRFRHRCSPLMLEKMDKSLFLMFGAPTSNLNQDQSGKLVRHHVLYQFRKFLWN